MARVVMPASSSPLPTLPLALETVLTIENVGACRDAMADILVNGGGPVVIAGESVEQVDTAGMQLLLVFSRELQECGRLWSWQGVSVALERAAVRLGVRHLLRMTPAAAPRAREARE